MNHTARYLSQSLVGIALQDPVLLDPIIRHVEPNDLDSPFGVILEAMVTLRDTMGGYTLSTVAEIVPGMSEWELSEIAAGVLPVYLDPFLDAFKQGKRLRIWHAAAQQMLAAVRLEDRDVAERRLADIAASIDERTSVLRTQPSITNAHDLMSMEFDEPTWAVPDLIPAGLTLFAGPPKVGKSGVVLDLALGVAVGGRAMSTLRCNKGSVLYLAVDNDTPRRLKFRLSRLLAGEPLDPDAHLSVVNDWSSGQQAIVDCQDWVTAEQAQGRRPLMVVVDTLVKVEPEFEGNGTVNAYAHSTKVLSRWSKFAHRNDLAVLMVHHDRKSDADDWLNRFSGSRGITATAQTLLMLDAKRGSKEGILRVSGRDVATDDLSLTRWNEFWTCFEMPRPTV